MNQKKMPPVDKSMEAAARLLARAYGTSLSNLNSVSNLRKVAQMGMDSAHGVLVERLAGQFKDFAARGKLKKLFDDAAEALESSGGVEGLAIKSARDQIDSFQRSIDAASIVFCHTTLDALALDFCRVTATAAPERWEPFIDQRQAKLADVKSRGYQELLREKVESDLVSLEKESLLKKIDRLFAVCQPPADFRPYDDYSFDRDVIVAFDEMRHGIVHQGFLNAPVRFGPGDIWFLIRTSGYLMALIVERFDLVMDPELFVLSMAGKASEKLARC